MNGSEEGGESSPDSIDQAMQGRVPLYPVSKVTKDLISFLEEGPPPEVQPARPATVSSVSLTPTTKSPKSGSRLQRMISKLNLSKEDRTPQEAQRGRGGGTASAPSTPLVRSFGANKPPPLPTAVKPVPPPILSIPPPVPISPPPSSQPSPDEDARSPTTRSDRPTRKMSVRKAVPTWGETVDQGVAIGDTGLTTPPHPQPTSPILNEQAQSPSPPTPAPEANGHMHNNNKSPWGDSPVVNPIPASTGLETPSHSPAPQENRNGRAEQPYPQGISRPRSSRPKHRSSLNDEQASSSWRCSGCQQRSSSGQAIAPTPSLSESLALDMRKLMLQSTTADECRLLLDTFLTRAGIVPPFSSVLDTMSSDVEPLERTLVHHFLGADLDELHTYPVTAEVERHPLPSTPESPPE